MDMTKTAKIPTGATFLSQLKSLAEEKPEKQAFVMIDKDFNKTILTRREVWDNSRKYAAILRRHGVQKGDIVCNTLVNSPERLVSALGTLASGAISMHGQIFLADGEDIIHSLKLAKCKTIIVDPGDDRGALPILTRLEYVDDTTGKTRYNGLPHLTTVIRFRVCCYDNQDASTQRGLKSLEGERDMFEEQYIDENDIAFIFATSGSTGFSKLVPHSHKSCLRFSEEFGVALGIDLDRSRYLSDSSLGWMGGFPGPQSVTGSTHILNDLSLGFPEKPDEHNFRLIDEEEIDCGILPGTRIEMFKNLAYSGKILRKRLRVVASGGMPVSQALVKGAYLFAESVNVVYGATESGIMSVHHVEQGETFEDYCSGLPFEGGHLKVVSEDRIEVPHGQVGQIAVKTSTMTSGYLHDQETFDKDLTKDGFFLLGDSGYMNDKGQIFVLGRQVHAIHKGIFIHYPGWLETRILNCPGVENVVAIGVPDPVLYEEICVCVIPTHDKTLTIEQLQQYCKNLFLMDSKADMSAEPKYYLLFDTFPCNSNGKLDRKILLKEACNRLGIIV